MPTAALLVIVKILKQFKYPSKGKWWGKKKLWHIDPKGYHSAIKKKKQMTDI